MASFPSWRPRRDTARALAATTAILAVVLTGCGGDPEQESTPAPSLSPGATAASGDPITTMTISAVDYNGPTYEDIQIVAKIYEQFINDRGGINGRPLNVLTCDDKGDPAQTTACAREAIDAGAVADVGSFTYNQSVMVPLYEQADMAVFGNCCNLAPIEFTTANTFQMGNNPVLNPAGVAQAVKDGCQSIGVLELDLPGITEGLEVIMENVAKSYGYTGDLKFVKVPLTTQDYTSQATQVTDGTDCISMFLSQSNISGFMPPFAQSGGTQRLYGAQGNFDKVATKGFEDLPGVVDGVVYGAYPPIQDPVWTEFRDALKTYNAPDTFDYNSLAALGTWAAFTAFTQIVEGIDGDISAKSFLDTASTATVDTGGMTPVIDFSKTWDAFDGAYARAFSRQVTYFKLSDFSPIGETWVDLTGPAEGLPAS